MEAKTREFHGHDSLLAGRESLCRDNAIEGNVGVRGESRLAAREAATMARPGPEGNLRAGLFPRLLQGLRDCMKPACRQAESALEQRLDLLVEFLERGLALDHLAIDEEGRRRVDLQHVAGEFLISGDFVQQRLVLEASFDRLLAEPGLFADSG